MTLLNWVTRHYLIAIGLVLVALMLLKKLFDGVSLEVSSMTLFGILTLIVVGQILVHYTRLKLVGWILTLAGAGVGLYILWGVYESLATDSIPDASPETIPDAPLETKANFTITDIQNFVMEINPWIRIGAGLILIGLIVMIKSVKNGSAIALFGLAFLFIALLFPVLAVKTDKVITSGENCALQGDCGPRADEIPTFNGGTVVIPRGGSKTFYVIGEVILPNNIDYCLIVSPERKFQEEYSEDGMTYFITPWSRQKERATVTSVPIGMSGCRHE